VDRTSFQEKATGGASRAVFLVAVLMCSSCSRAQYERWTLPFAVSSPCRSRCSARCSCVPARPRNDIYFQIGLVTLIALASKERDPIVEFASLKVQEGMSFADAAVEGRGCASVRSS